MLLWATCAGAQQRPSTLLFCNGSVSRSPMTQDPAWRLIHAEPRHSLIEARVVHGKGSLAQTTPIATSSQTKARTKLDPGTMNDLTTWIVAKSGFAPRAAPIVRFVASAQLNRMYFGKDYESNGVSVRALYEKKTNTIYLSDTWDPHSLHDRSYLVHELVHHLQFSNNVEVACDSAYNRKAYQLQFDWLSEQGVRDPQAFLGISDIVLFSTTQCPLFDACQFLPEGCP
jgi:hypothetical protein